MATMVQVGREPKRGFNLEHVTRWHFSPAPELAPEEIKEGPGRPIPATLKIFTSDGGSLAFYDLEAEEGRRFLERVSALTLDVEQKAGTR